MWYDAVCSYEPFRVGFICIHVYLFLQHAAQICPTEMTSYVQFYRDKILSIEGAAAKSWSEYTTDVIISL